MSPKIVLVTGATSGIGAATVKKFAENGNVIIGTGRRQERLNSLEDELASKDAVFIPLCFDIRIQDAVESAFNSLPIEYQAVDILINNAGLSRGLAPIQQGSIEDWEEMIDTNIKGLLYISRIVSSQMSQRKRGHIINIGSTAGKEAYPNGNVYCATKHAVDALTKAMRMDLLADNVKVSAIHPGLVETEFSIVRFRGDEARAAKVYDGFNPLSPVDVADVIYWVTHAPINVNIADVLLLPSAQASALVVNREFNT